MNLKTWWLAARPKTLAAGVAPIAVASALVYLNGYPIVWWITGSALLCTLFLQIATNLFNDAIDFKKGADTKERIGPTRITASGMVSSRAVMISGIFALALAAAFGLPLLARGGEVFLLIGLISMVLAYAYTGGPFPLAYLGLGELFVVLFFGLVAVGGTYFLQTFNLNRDAIILGLQQGFLATVLIVVNNARDIYQDKKAGKKTLAVRFGLRFAKFEVLICYLAVLLLNLHWWLSGWPLLSALLFLTLLFAALVLKLFWGLEPSEKYNEVLALAGLAQLAFSIQFCLGVWLESFL